MHYLRVRVEVREEEREEAVVCADVDDELRRLRERPAPELAVDVALELLADVVDLVLRVLESRHRDQVGGDGQPTCAVCFLLYVF